MNQYNQNEIDGRGTWPELEIGMDFYIPVGVIFIQLEDCSNYTTGLESKSLLRDETDFVSGNDYTQTRTAFLCVGYDGTWAELSSGE